MGSFTDINVRRWNHSVACETLGGRATGQSVSPERVARAKHSKRLAHVAMAASESTQERMAAAIGVSMSRVRQCLSPAPEHIWHDFHYRDICAMPDEAKRIYLGDLLDQLGEESRPILDSDGKALLAAILREHSDVAFVLRAAMEDGLFDEDQVAQVRAASLELLAVIGSIVSRCDERGPSIAKTAGRIGAKRVAK